MDQECITSYLIGQVLQIPLPEQFGTGTEKALKLRVIQFYINLIGDGTGGKKKKKRKKNKYRQKFGQRESIAAENVTGLGTKSTATKGQVSATKDESRLSNLYWTSQENITVKFNRIIQRENVVSHLSPSTPTIAALWKDSDGNLCVKAKGRNCCWFCLTFEPRDVGTSEIMHQKCSPRL